jgi:hypothetical protein
MKSRSWLLMGFITVVFALTGCENALNGDGHNSGGGGNTNLASTRSVENDPVSGCVNENVHSHDGEHYSGHYNNDGHGHQGLQADEPCAQQGCQKTDLHKHNGTHYAGHSGADGHHGNEHA